MTYLVGQCSQIRPPAKLFIDGSLSCQCPTWVLLARAGDQDQLQQDVANLKIDSKRREIRLTKMLSSASRLSSASQKTKSERELGQVFEAVLVQGDKGCRSYVTIAPCAVCVHTRASYPLNMHVNQGTVRFDLYPVSYMTGTVPNSATAMLLLTCLPSSW